ncbi:hypothetical protein [Mesobacterium pallidum]|uniref:hypothetical protein n=1 Tax=Mesobacterium pallidum TaxID=2872037 RepID=UPI001EE273E9|nr:hypothetical protein [Mesobacterium pallidum]
MDWTAQVDGYCERLGPGLWAEPLNAVSNLAFIAVALWLWPRVGGAARGLCAVLMAIGIGSGLFHTLAMRWAGVADTLPILVFVLAYIWLANRDWLGWPRWAAALGTAGFFPYAAATLPLFARIPGIGGSAGYAPIPLLLLIYAAILRRRPQVARGLVIGAAILALSITARALDMPLCGRWPHGTHVAWHLLNATMLGWMIVVYHRSRLEGAGRRR